MNTPLPLAVCVFIMNKKGEVLGISRRDDPTQWGYPGGKVDPGETPIQAIIREIWEECGIRLDESKLIEGYRGECPGDVHYDVITYFHDAEGPAIEDCLAETGLTLRYHNDSFMLNKANSPFADYNRQVYIAFARLLEEDQKIQSGVTDEQLRERFKISVPGPNPFYRCSKCDAMQVGIRDELVEHYKACP